MKSTQQKRIEADERNKAWASLTPQQQLASLAKRRGNSQKQIERICKLFPEVVAWKCDKCDAKDRNPGDIQVLERGPKLCLRCRPVKSAS